MATGNGNLVAYIEENYGVTGERLFSKYPDFQVFRHQGNRKWFAVIMDIPKEKLGLSGDSITVVNLKCDTRMIEEFRREPGIYPGYHMNKSHWLTVALDGSAKKEHLLFLLEMSYDLTKGVKG